MESTADGLVIEPQTRATTNASAGQILAERVSPPVAHGNFRLAERYWPQSPANAINRPHTSAPSQQTVETMA